MSADLVDLLRRVLDKNPDERATLKDIMCHAWVTVGGTLPAVDATETATAEPTARELLNSIDTDDAFDARLIIDGASVGVSRTYEKGDLLMQQGEEGTEMFVIESGRVRVQTRKEGHRRAARDDITRRSIDEDFDFDMSA
jgi:serine/threonine protein kinase